MNNPTGKGNLFEDRVYGAISQELNAERLGILPHSCEIYKKKPYYSRDRGSDIIVDLSIEVTLPNANRWSLLWVWECKDYQKAIPVDDVEEFHAKLDQIAGDNIKGSIAISGAVQKAALTYASAKGIGVVRLLPDDQVKWILFHSLSTNDEDKLNPRQFQRALTTPNFQSTNRDFYAVANGYIFGNWYSLIENGIKSFIKV